MREVLSAVGAGQGGGEQGNCSGLTGKGRLSCMGIEVQAGGDHDPSAETGVGQ